MKLFLLKFSPFLFFVFIFASSSALARKALPTCQPCAEFFAKGQEIMRAHTTVTANPLDPAKSRSHIQIVKDMQKLFIDYVPQIAPLDTSQKVDALLNTWLLVIDYNPVGDVANISTIKEAIGTEGFAKLHLSIAQRIALEKNPEKKSSLRKLKHALTYVGRS